MSNQETYENIDAYLNGELSGPDLAKFETALSEQPDLAKQVTMMKEMNVALRDEATLDFQKMVQEEGASFLQKNESTAKVRKLTWSRQLIGLVATAAILVGALLIWKMSPRSAPNGPELFAQHFETYTLNQSLRGETSADNSTFNAGIARYQDGDYTAAAQTFQQLATVAPADMELAFCLGNAYLNQSPPSHSAAQTQFEKVIDENNSIYVLRSKWYLALIKLNDGDTASASNLLKEVAQVNDKYGKVAQQILQELK